MACETVVGGETVYHRPRRQPPGGGVWSGEAGGARTGPGREGPEARPPRRKVGAGERSPSAPRLGPSIVKERGGEAPRDEPGEPHSPGLLPFGGGFVSREDLFAPHSLLFASHSPGFEPSEGEKKRRELHLERREGEGMSHSPGFASSELPFASHSLGFEPHSPGFAPSEGEKKRRELHLERREGEGMNHSPGFASFELPFASHSPEIARLDELFAPSEEEGTRPERGGMRPEQVFMPCTSELAGQNLRGMSHKLRGTGPVEELPWLDSRKTSSETNETSYHSLMLQSFSPSWRGLEPSQGAGPEKNFPPGA